MGGSRCTYKNCTVRSDGLVHMFHYPVYDKVRCHQWLVNAHRLDFLNLKLSQLRNRVICQHHFKDEVFMNYLKEKLTFDAIPTEDGPFCKSAEHKNLPVDHIAKAYSSALTEADETDKYSKVMANPSMIYADFLTNGDLWEKQSLNETIWNNMVITPKVKAHEDKMSLACHKADLKKENEDCQSLISLSDIIEDTSKTKITVFENPFLADITFEPKNESKNEYQNTKKESSKVVSSESSQKVTKNSNKTEIILSIDQIPNEVVNRENNFNVPEQNLHNLLVSNDNNNILVNFDHFVGQNNLSTEKTYYEIEIPAKQDHQIFDNNNEMPQSEQAVQIVTTSTTKDYRAIIQNPKELAMQAESNNVNLDESFNFINLGQWPNEKKNDQAQYDATKRPKVTILSQKTISDPVLIKGQLEPVSPSAFINLPKKTSSDPILDLEIEQESNDTKKIKTNENIPPFQEVMRETENNNNLNIRKKRKIREILQKQCVVKHKMAPERVAAIEKKRRFNKKLLDIIEICIDKLDDQEKIVEEVKIADSPKIKESQTKAKSLQQNVSTYLSKETELPNPQEYMMKFLEARMKKMEDTLLSKIDQNSQKIVELKESIGHVPQSNKTTGTQTRHSEEMYKKQLYKEISQFLSPNISSMVYEELFIQKFSPEIPNKPSLPKKPRNR